MALGVAQGSFVGTGAALSVTGLSFKPRVLILKANLNVVAYLVTDTMAAGNAIEFDGQSAAGLLTGYVTSLDAAGFTMGTNANVNTNGTTTYWWALGDAASTQLFTGSYSGTGAVQSVTGFAAQPVLVSTHTATVTDGAAFQTSTMTANDSLGYHTSPPVAASRITSLNATGFSLGTDATTNTNTATYYYWAVASSSLLATFQYVGNGAATQAITGLSIAPNIVMLRDTNTSVTNTGNFTETSMIALGGIYVSAHTLDSTMYTALGGAGFTVGNSVATNTNADTYFGYAFATGGVVPTPSVSTLLLMGV